MLVRLIKWDYPSLGRQTPGESFRWKDITFTEDPVEDCDHVIVLNHAASPAWFRCSPDRVWAIIGEPPTEHRAGLHRGLPEYARIYMQDPKRTGPRYVHSHGALPWRVGKTYDELVAMAPPEKTRGLSWITSSSTLVQGHHDRLTLLDRIRRSGLEIDVYGRGIREIDDKWDGLAPYRYSLAIENTSNPYYWTEKVADALLAWTMPIYYGCTTLERWLPAEALIRLDIHDPDAPARIRDIVASDAWLTRREAIAEARRLILDKHQLFPFMHDEIHRFLDEGGAAIRPPRRIELEPYPDTREGWRADVRRAFARAARSLASPRVLRLGRRLWPR